MTTSRELHHQAMDYATRGFMAQMSASPSDAEPLFAQALELEKASIETLPEPREELDWYYVLHRSAGWMAFHAGELREAERLAARALAGEPPADIAAELRDLIDQIVARRHLLERGLEIRPGQLRMTVAGEAVGNGYIDMDWWLSGAEAMERALHLLVDNRQGLPFAKRKPADVRRRYPVHIARAAELQTDEYATAFRMARPVDEAGAVEPAVILNEFVELMELARAGDQDGLESRLPDAGYRNAFLRASRKLSPKGAKISRVNFVVE